MKQLDTGRDAHRLGLSPRDVALRGSSGRPVAECVEGSDEKPRSQQFAAEKAQREARSHAWAAVDPSGANPIRSRLSSTASDFGLDFGGDGGAERDARGQWSSLSPSFEC